MLPATNCWYYGTQQSQETSRRFELVSKRRARCSSILLHPPGLLVLFPLFPQSSKVFDGLMRSIGQRQRTASLKRILWRTTSDLPTYLPNYLPICLSAYLPTSLPPYLPAVDTAPRITESHTQIHVSRTHQIHAINSYTLRQ